MRMMIIKIQKSIYIDSHSTVDHNDSNDSDTNKSNGNYSKDDK